MAKSELLDNLKIDIAPYVRNAIVGYGNRIGNDAFYGGKVFDMESTYVLDGKKVTVTSENDQNFFKVVAFVEKMLKIEIGRANKSDQKLDELIGEILHALKYNSYSTERNMNNVSENEILTDRDFQEAQEAFKRLDNDLSNSLNESNIDGFSNVVIDGKYGSLKNKMNTLRGKLINPNANYSQSEKEDIIAEFESIKQEAIDVQTTIKQDAKSILDSDPEKVKALKEKSKDLVQTAKNNPKGSAEYNEAIAESRILKEENKEIFESDRRVKNSNEELRELRNLTPMGKGLESNENQYGM